ncbi:hypothetical protein AN958_09439 [Leucoagaricus sp. SymC.cos]|nr:hypothetical protein AN958_09439 [Leucoagaricus sp. SymC.cos]
MCVATVYDDRHWECECERACTHATENLTTSSQPCKNPTENSSSQCQSSSNNRPSSNPHSHNKQQSSSTSGPNNNNNNNKNTQPPQQQSPAKSSTPTLILGKDSKLTEAEKQCCINKNLCSYCRIFGHQVETCKCKEANQKACAFNVELPAMSSASAPTKGSEK